MIKSVSKNAPYLITVPATSLIVALGSTGLALGRTGIIAGAALGLVWSVALGRGTERVMRRPEWRRRFANASVFLGILASGVMVGGGLMYGFLMRAAAMAPAEVVSALMQPAVPFFIILNTPLELLVVPAAVFTNWQNDARRRLMLIAAAGFYAMRVWSYLVYVPHRMELASRPLLPQDREWFQRSMDVDYRGILVAAVFVLFTITAFVSDEPAAVAVAKPRRE